MSGAEAAGLALAVLPILVHATEHYNDVFRPFIRYKNCCRLLLAAVTEYDVASSMLNGPEHPSWMDTKLDNQLIKLLAESREVCVSTIQLMQEELRKIGNECQAIWFEIDPSDQKPSDVKGSKAWRARVVKKLRFSVSKPRLDETLVSLRSLNEDFRTLSSQIIKTASYQPKVNTQRRSHCQHEIRKYNIIREASQQVYRALGNACTKHTEHQARFRIEVEQMTVNEGECSQVKFEMAFAHLTLTSPAQLGELRTFVGNPWLFGLGIVLLEIAHSSSLESFKRQSDLDHGREDQHTEFFLAQRVAASGFTDMGGKYHNIIQKLVKCDFGCGTDLNDIELQAAFHNEVICPLEKLENDLRQFHFDIEPS
ncbi:hypothetical protein P7C71_g2647, partial [Lecanoromycetidae sp. Uapishka_2]